MLAFEYMVNSLINNPVKMNSYKIKMDYKILSVVYLK